MSRILLLLGIVYFFGTALKAQPVDSLKQLYEESENDSIRLHALNELAWEYRYLHPEAAIRYAEEAAVLARQRKDTGALASALLRKAFTLRKQGHLNQAEPLNAEAVQLKAAIRDTLGLAMALGNLSQLNRLQGHYKKAIKHRLESIELLVHPRFQPQRMAGYNNLGGIHVSLKHYEQAIEEYRNCLTLALQLSDSAMQARVWYNLGASYFALKQYAIARQFYQQALTLATSHLDQPTQALLYNSLGNMHHLQREEQAALEQYKKAELIYDSLGFSVEKIMIYNNLAAVYQSQGEAEKTLLYYHRAANLAQALKSPQDLPQIYLNLSQGFEAYRQPDSALYYFKLANQIKDSLFTAEKNRQIVEMQEKYESAKKDQSIAELNEDKARKEADIQVRNLLLGASGILFLMALGFGINYFQKLRTQKKLAARESELNRNQLVQVMQDSELKSVNAYLDGENAERERLAGELHDHLGAHLATVKLHYDHIASTIQEEQQLQQLQKANDLLGLALVELRQIAHNLASGVLNKFGLVSATEDLCNAISESGTITVQVDAFELDNRLPPALELTLFRAVQELLSNVIKHAGASEVNVQLIRHDDHVSIMVEDNGIGFSTTAQPSGIGLHTMANRATNLGGTLNIDSKPGHGTTVILEVPFSQS